MEEVWKEIRGYEGLYEVSNLGRVRRASISNRLHNDGILKPIKRNNYLKVVLSKEGNKTDYFIHRLVAETFIENPNNLPYVNHIDEVKTNNTTNNLEWCDALYNTNYGSGILRRSTTKVLNGKTCKPIEVENTLTKEITTHRNMTECALFYGTSRIQLRRCIRNNKLLNNILKVKEL